MNGHGRGTFSCRIDGRAGYLRLFDDRIELIRSGRRGPQVLGLQIFPMYQVSGVSVGKPGMLLTAVDLVVAGGLVELKVPSADAPRVADLIDLLMRDAVAPMDAYEPAAYEPAHYAPVTYEPAAYEPAPYAPVAYEPAAYEPEPVPVAQFPSVPLPVAPAPAPAEPMVSAFVVPASAVEGDRAFEVSTIHIPELVIPEILMPEWRSLPETAELLPELEALPALTIPTVEMPEWIPLPETDLPELVLSQIVLEELAPTVATFPMPSDPAEPITEIAPLPDGSVLAAAAALAELEDLLSQIDAASPESLADGLVESSFEADESGDGDDDIVAKAREILAPVQASDSSIPAQPSEAVLTLAAAALLGGAQQAAEEATPAPPAPTRPANLSPELEKRLARLDTLRSCGVLSEDDYTTFEAEIFELAWAEPKSA